MFPTLFVEMTRVFTMRKNSKCKKKLFSENLFIFSILHRGTLGRRKSTFEKTQVRIERISFPNVPLCSCFFFSFFSAIHIVFFDFNWKTITCIHPTKSEHVYTFDGTLSEHAKGQVIVK